MLYDKILNTAKEILHADLALLQLFHPGRGVAGELKLLGHRGFSEYAAMSYEIRPDSQSPCSIALNTRKRVAIPDVRQCNFLAGSVDLIAFLHNDVIAIQVTPLLSRNGDLVGVLSTYWRKPYELTASEIRSLDILARQATDLIERTQAEKALRESEARKHDSLDRFLLDRDITDRKHAEEALQKTYDELEHRVVERTSDLAWANEKLQQEINKHQKTEKALLESEKRYRLLVNNVNEAIVVIQDNLIKFANPKAIQLLGCSLDKLSSTDIFEFIHPDDRKHFLKRYIKRIMGEKLENPYSLRLVASDGSIKWHESSAVLIEWEGRLATLCLMTDITERKKMDEEMIKADKLESLGLLAGGIAHDFNNFLATLLGNITLAKLYKDENKKFLKNWRVWRKQHSGLKILPINFLLLLRVQNQLKKR